MWGQSQMIQISLESVTTAAQPNVLSNVPKMKSERNVDVYFSADIETDGPIPGPYSILSFALVFAGTYDGKTFTRPSDYEKNFYRELRPISSDYEPEALAVNGLDRTWLVQNGMPPEQAMREANDWVRAVAGDGNPVFVAYPLSFDWTWLYWYFVRFSHRGSPFGHSRCFDIKTAVSVKTGFPIAGSGRSKLPGRLLPSGRHTHHALDDAIEQAEIFANVFEWEA
ncbi:3'-5' exoribonuclease [Sinorhizobium meliloti]|nr:3'-5' exoribonuclease [Sinorhizobium meliloti]RVG45616.1 exonuclease [Sinorhizobium meliloti]RVM38795.1 exonuclease [Sinorhizobium meliloti]RVN56367.1 exonuclease [Sinorhizobium meliloti]